MKKVIVLLLIIIIVLSISACSTETELKIGAYEYNEPFVGDDSKVFVTSHVIIKDNNEMIFRVPSPLISYSPGGKYTFKNNVITLVANYTYKWKVDGDKLEYIGDEVDAYRLKRGLKFRYIGDESNAYDIKRILKYRYIDNNN